MEMPQRSTGRTRTSDSFPKKDERTICSTDLVQKWVGQSSIKTSVKGVGLSKKRKAGSNYIRSLGNRSFLIFRFGNWFESQRKP